MALPSIPEGHSLWKRATLLTVNDGTGYEMFHGQGSLIWACWKWGENGFSSASLAESRGFLCYALWKEHLCRGHYKTKSLSRVMTSFSIDLWVSGQALMPTADLLPVCVCLTCVGFKTAILIFLGSFLETPVCYGRKQRPLVSIYAGFTFLYRNLKLFHILFPLPALCAFTAGNTFQSGSFAEFIGWRRYRGSLVQRPTVL